MLIKGWKMIILTIDTINSLLFNVFMFDFEILNQ